jgi:hypothetical protein
MPGDVAQLRDTALGLPPGWVVAIEPPYGQLAIVPRERHRRHATCWIIDGEKRRAYRTPWLPAA